MNVRWPEAVGWLGLKRFSRVCPSSHKESLQFALIPQPISSLLVVMSSGKTAVGQPQDDEPEVTFRAAHNEAAATALYL